MADVCPTCGQPLNGQMELGSLDEAPASHHGDPNTSRRAAKDAWPRANTQRRIVLGLLHASGARGLTGDELNEKLGGVGASYQNGQRRLSDLKRGGWVDERRDSHAVPLADNEQAGPTGRVDRKTRAGAWARVYVLTAAAEVHMIDDQKERDEVG